jgi:hypothetical protein
MASARSNRRPIFARLRWSDPPPRRVVVCHRNSNGNTTRGEFRCPGPRRLAQRAAAAAPPPSVGAMPVQTYIRPAALLRSRQGAGLLCITPRTGPRRARRPRNGLMRERPPHRLVTAVHYQYRWCAYPRVRRAPRRAQLSRAPRPDPPPLLSQLETEPSDAYQRWREMGCCGRTCCPPNRCNTTCCPAV